MRPAMLRNCSVPNSRALVICPEDDGLLQALARVQRKAGQDEKALATLTATQVWVQTKSVLVTIAYTGVVSLVLLKLVDLTIGLKVNADDERIGLDLSDHAEHAYTLLD